MCLTAGAKLTSITKMIRETRCQDRSLSCKTRSVESLKQYMSGISMNCKHFVLIHIFDDRKRPLESKNELCEKLSEFPAICPKLENNFVKENLIDLDRTFAVAGYEGHLLQVECYSHETGFIGSYKLRNPALRDLRLGSFLWNMPVFDVISAPGGAYFSPGGYKVIN